MAVENLVLRANAQRGYGVYTTVERKKGERLYSYGGEVMPVYLSNSVTRRMTINKHFCLQWEPGGCQCYINHSCDPNCYIEWENGMPHLTARRDIPVDEEICYNYNTVELELVDWTAFPCHCHNGNCIGWIRGFQYLTPNQELGLLEMLSPYLKSVREEYVKNREGS